MVGIRGTFLHGAAAGGLVAGVAQLLALCAPQPCGARGRCGVGRSGTRLPTLPAGPCRNGWFESTPDPFPLSPVPTAVACPSS